MRSALRQVGGGQWKLIGCKYHNFTLKWIKLSYHWQFDKY